MSRARETGMLWLWDGLANHSFIGAALLTAGIALVLHASRKSWSGT
jgi:hypothetical protein